MNGRTFVGLALFTFIALTAVGCRVSAKPRPAERDVGALTLEPAVKASEKPTLLARECAHAAQRAGFPIACPSTLPRASNPFWGDGFGGGECDPKTSERVRLSRWTWVGTYFPIGAGLGHVVVASAPHIIEPSSFIYLVGTVEPHLSRRVTVAGEATVRGHAAKYVHPSLNTSFDPPPRVGGIVFMGQTVLIWTEHGHTYAVGIAGPRIEARSIEAAIARRLTFATPPKA